MAARFPMIVALLVSMAAAPSAFAEPSLQDLVGRSMQACHDGRIAKARADRLAHFERGQRWGEQAVAMDERSAAAHFSLFCNLGELMRIDGEMNLSSVFGFRRMMRELDRTLELAPDHLDALSARGTFLVRLPSFLGGDPNRGEALLRYVITREPQAVNARLSLAKSYCGRGRHSEAVTLAAEALSLAHAQQRDDFIPEATRVLSQINTAPNKAN
ncbi:MAG TPA: hypothetical protein VFS39_17225 [Nitrospira sp.]|nr:hypothetical protein [Nitrospira sp.]